jgi:hypothetical protein
MATLEQKRAEEYENEKLVRTQATDEYTGWNTQRDIRLNAKKETNRSEEQVLLESVESEVEILQTWDRVAKLIDLKEKEAEKSDTSRMHKLFIQLKVRDVLHS